MAKQPGRSHRTPFKHWLLDVLLGQIVGVLGLQSPKVPALASPYFYVADLCAGDCNLINGDIYTCSPSIIGHHCDYLHNKKMKSKVVLVEKAAHTFDLLQRNTLGLEGLGDVQLIHGDARRHRLPPLGDRQAAFIHCDPNNVDEMPLVNPLVSQMNKFTTYLVTLGCNVGGLKRLSIEKRKKWFHYVRDLTDDLPSWHDAVLVSINGDGSQWAYLFRLPKVWTEKHLNAIHKKGNKMFSRGVTAISLKRDYDGFQQVQKVLFLTKEERCANS